uniref:Uncharacterized protein n=1 Tax=Rhabditophanes sp. KR3021 TaxID=114890 RepID=A0AC35U5U2_9BILA
MIITLSKLCPIFLIYFTTLSTFCSSCELNPLIRGHFKLKTFESNANGSKQIFEDIIIEATSVSKWGDCIESHERHNYILKSKEENKIGCYKCVLLVPKTINVVHLVYAKNDICHPDVTHAKMECFEANLSGINDGALLFKEHGSQPVPCGFHGLYNTQYSEIGSEEKCDSNDSMNVENCKYKEILSISFSNCKGGKVQKSFFCLGNFKEKNNSEFTALFDLDSGLHYCSKRVSKSDQIELYIGDPFKCEISPEKNGTEIYIFNKKSSIPERTLCTFPESLYGNYETFDIKANVLAYKKNVDNFENLSSYCIAKTDTAFLVKTVTECGAPLSYNCFHFNIRSPSITQIKITQVQGNELRECRSKETSDNSVWVSTIRKDARSMFCGFKGHWATTYDNKTKRCFSVVVKPAEFTSFSLVGFDCTDNSVFDSKYYECYGTWSEGNKTFLYTKEIKLGSKLNTCFLLQKIGEKLMFTKIGAQCIQSFNLNQTLILENKTIREDPGVLASNEFVRDDTTKSIQIDQKTAQVEEPFIQADDQHQKMTINISSKVFIFPWIHILTFAITYIIL